MRTNFSRIINGTICYPVASAIARFIDVSDVTVDEDVDDVEDIMSFAVYNIVFK